MKIKVKKERNGREKEGRLSIYGIGEGGRVEEKETWEL